jgi:hypothetical protein
MPSVYRQIRQTRPGQVVKYLGEVGTVTRVLNVWYGRVVQVRFDATECTRSIDEGLLD